MKMSKKIHRIRAGTNAVVSIIGAMVILFCVNYLAMRHYVRSDWTLDKIYTLSQKTQKVLQSLPAQVTIHMLWSKNDRRYPDAKELLDRYAASSPKVTLEVVDPDIHPDRLKILLGRYGDVKRAGFEGGAVIVVSGDNVKFVPASEFEDNTIGDLTNPDQSQGEQLSSFVAEQTLTSSIMHVSGRNQPTVCFTRDHGELPIDVFDHRGLGHVKNELSQDGFRVRSIASGQPATGCALVVIANPQKAFSDDEADRLKNYLLDGGGVIALLDPIIVGDAFAPTGLEKLTAQMGIVLRTDVVIDQSYADGHEFMTNDFTIHPAVEHLAKRQVMFSVSRSLGVKDPTMDSVTAVLARASELSWGETNLKSIGSGRTAPTLNETDNRGPSILAMAATVAPKKPGAKPGQLVVVGDSDFLSYDLYNHGRLSNRDLWSSLVGWMTTRDDLISIAPKNPEHLRLELSQAQRKLVFQILLGEILVFLILGVVVWVSRRS